MVKSMGIPLFMVFLSYAFNVHQISGSDLSFFSDIVNLYHLSLSFWLA